nr:signal peptidase I [uncultured Arsenicibacter sp.]
MFGKKPATAEKKPHARKSPLREWIDSVLFAVVAATLIRFLVMEAFAIPTPSMESNLMVGDYLFVSKLHYGSRTPQTPLQMPLTHQKIWGTNIPSFSTAIQLPTFRLPGFTQVKNGDVVVFNYPPLRPNEPDYPKDLRTNYIKRCIGIPGDVVQIRQEQVFINGKAAPLPERAQTTWFMKTTEVLDDHFFRQYAIVNDFNSPEGPFINWQPVEVQNAATKASELIGYRINTSRAMLDKIKALDWVKGVEPLTEPAGQTGPGIYGSSVYAWNQDNFGPLTVPKKGMTVPVNRETIALYGPVISRYEDNANVVQTPTSITIGGKAVTEYTFKQDYYFMMGDNRHNSEDSRYWGFVPEDHVVGKAVFVWMSVDPAPENVWRKIRWNRLFRVIR